MFGNLGDCIGVTKQIKCDIQTYPNRLSKNIWNEYKYKKHTGIVIKIRSVYTVLWNSNWQFMCRMALCGRWIMFYRVNVIDMSVHYNQSQDKINRIAYIWEKHNVISLEWNWSKAAAYLLQMHMYAKYAAYLVMVHGCGGLFSVFSLRQYYL